MKTYNGFSPQQREKKRRALHRVFPGRSHPYFHGPCHMCGDPHSPVAPHDEDYSEPFVWETPAMYALCRTCHGRIHRRSKSPSAWQAYVAHLHRGGYGSDLKERPISREIAKLSKTIQAGQGVHLEPLREVQICGRWWEREVGL